MITPALCEFSATLGLCGEQNFAHGEYEGYYITIFGNAENKAVFFNYFLGGEQSEIDLKSFEFSEKLKELMEKYSIVSYEIDTNGVNVISADSYTDFRKLIDEIVESLKENGYSGCDICSSCGNATGDSGKRVYVKENNYVLCANCAFAELAKHNEEASPKKPEYKKDSILKGSLGALLGAFLGGLIFLAAYAFVIPQKEIWNFKSGYFAAWIPLFMTWFALIGFKKASGGRKDIARVVSSGIITAIIVIIFQYLSSVCFFIRVEDITADQFRLAGKYIFEIPFVDNVEGASFIRYLLWDLTFVICGLILFSYSPSSTQKAQPLKIENIVHFGISEEEEEDSEPILESASDSDASDEKEDDSSDSDASDVKKED